MPDYAQKLLLTDPSNYTNLQVGGGYINDNFAVIFDGVSIDTVSYNWTFSGTITGNGLLDNAGTLRSTNASAATSGAGLEHYYSGGVGVIQPYDRTGLVYKPLWLRGETIDLKIGVVTAFAIDVDKNVSIPDGRFLPSYSGNNFPIVISATNAGFNLAVLYGKSTRAASTDFDLIRMASSDGADNEFRVKGDGAVLSDAGTYGTGADRGECLRWYDDNPLAEDRMGWSVVFKDGVIYPADHAAVAALEPTGIISATADSIGNAGALRWHGKYAIDGFGRKELELYSQISWVEVVEGSEDINHSYQLDKIPVGLIAPTDAITTSVDENGAPLMRRKLNPLYDTTLTYVPRLERMEYDVMGMTGLVRMIKGQRTAPNWRKGNDISITVEEWLVK